MKGALISGKGYVPGRRMGLSEALGCALTCAGFAPDALVDFSQPHGFAVDRRAYFLLLRQKKVAKEKATPRSAPGYARSLALLGRPGGRRELAFGSNSASRLPPAHLRCSAPPTGARKASQLCRSAQKMFSSGRPAIEPKNSPWRSSVDDFPGPLEGAEQRRAGGGSRMALFEGAARVRASHPPVRVAQGSPEGAADLGSPFLCQLSFGEAKESSVAGQRRNPTLIQTSSAPVTAQKSF